MAYVDSLEESNMPFRQSSVMDERMRFVIEVGRHDRSFSEVCRCFGISRPTGYLWLERFRKEGKLLLLQEKSRRPRRMPRMTSQTVVDRIVV